MEGCSENASHFREGPSCWLDIGQAVTGGGHVVYLNLNSQALRPSLLVKEIALKKYMIYTKILYLNI